LNGEVILYADIKTQSIQRFLAVADYRRQKQLAYIMSMDHAAQRRPRRRRSLSSYRQTTDRAQAL